MKAGPWESLTIEYDLNTSIGTIRTVNGHYVTAVNGGGVGGPKTVPIHTDATEIGPCETFVLDDFGEL
jgi:hypothetical protein